MLRKSNQKRKNRPISVFDLNKEEGESSSAEVVLEAEYEKVILHWNKQEIRCIYSLMFILHTKYMTWVLFLFIQVFWRKLEKLRILIWKWIEEIYFMGLNFGITIILITRLIWSKTIKQLRPLLVHFLTSFLGGACCGFWVLKWHDFYLYCLRFLYLQKVCLMYIL